MPRISLTAAALTDAKLIVLFTRGAAKRALIERVLAEPAFAPPVAALIRQEKAPIRLIWSGAPT